MKKQYIAPQTYLNDYIAPLMEEIGVGSNPNEDDILGKDRNEDFLEDEQKDSWSNGLW